MGGLLSNQSAVNEVTERANYLIEERIGKIPANYRVSFILHVCFFTIKNSYTNF